MNSSQPSKAFVISAWAVLAAGMFSYLLGLWNAEMMLNEKGYYFTILMYGLFSAISVQKCVRDKLEGIKITPVYFGLSWFSTILAISLLAIGLWNATLLLSEKGFYAMSYLLSLFAAITAQKNTRDISATKSFKEEETLTKFL